MQGMLDVLLGHPVTPLARTILVALGGLTMLCVLIQMGGASGIPNVGRYYALAVGAVGLLMILTGMVVTKGHILPRVSPAVSTYALYVGGFTFSTVAVILMMRILQKASFTAALATWFVSLFFSMVVVVIIGAVLDIVFEGSNRLQRTQERTIEMEHILADL
jgi:hypothetical protein